VLELRKAGDDGPGRIERVEQMAVSLDGERLRSQRLFWSAPLEDALPLAPIIGPLAQAFVGDMLDQSVLHGQRQLIAISAVSDGFPLLGPRDRVGRRIHQPGNLQCEADGAVLRFLVIEAFDEPARYCANRWVSQELDYEAERFDHIRLPGRIGAEQGDNLGCPCRRLREYRPEAIEPVGYLPGDTEIDHLALSDRQEVLNLDQMNHGATFRDLK